MIDLIDLSKLVCSLSRKGTYVGQHAAVERGSSQGARSGSTGPTFVPFQSFSLCAFYEQEGWSGGSLSPFPARTIVAIKPLEASKVVGAEASTKLDDYVT